MFPNCQINMGYGDPLLAPRGFEQANYIDTELNRLEQAKQQLIAARDNIQLPVKGTTINNGHLWADIDSEIATLNADQQKILANDEEYQAIDKELQMLIQAELINSVKDKVANSERGKVLLERQLTNIKDKKNKIVEESNKEIELFRKFQIAAQANPNLSYVEFIKAINNEK